MAAVDVEEIKETLRRVLAEEKPSGQWRAGERAVAHTGEILSSRVDDPGYFLGGCSMSPAERAALVAANSVEEGPGLTWRDFSEARGYSPEEIERYGRVLSWKRGAAWWEVAAAAGYESASEALASEEGLLDLAAVLHAWNRA